MEEQTGPRIAPRSAELLTGTFGPAEPLAAASAAPPAAPSAGPLAGASAGPLAGAFAAPPRAPAGGPLTGTSAPADLLADAQDPADLLADAQDAADPLTDTSGPPLRRDGLLARIAPFAVLACLAEASLALPPGPASLPEAIASALILAATAALVVLVPWDRLPAWCDVAVPLLYTASVLPLAQAAGGTYSGILLILLSPIIWTALFHRRWESALRERGRPGRGADRLADARHGQPGRAHPPDDLLGGAGRHDRGGRARAARPDPPVPPAGRPDAGAAARDEHPGRPGPDRRQPARHGGAAAVRVGPVAAGHGRPARRPAEVAGRIGQVVQDLDESITLLRQSIFDPAHEAPAQGLRRSILDVSRELTPWLGMVPEVTLEGPLDTAVPPPAARQLLGVLREGLAGSGAGAQATQVAVAVAADHEAVHADHHRRRHPVGRPVRRERADPARAAGPGCTRSAGRWRPRSRRPARPG